MKSLKLFFYFLPIILLSSCSKYNTPPDNKNSFPPIELKNWQYNKSDLPKDNTGNFIWLNCSENNPEWIKIDDVKIISDREIKLYDKTGKGKTTIWFKAALPDWKGLAPSVLVPFTRGIMEVYLDGKMLFSNADFSPEEKRTTTGFGWYLIKLPEYSSEQNSSRHNKNIYFRLRLNQKGIIPSFLGNAIGLSSPVLIGSTDDLTKKIITDDLDNILTGSLIIIIGLITLFIFIFFQRNRLLLGITLFFLSSGVSICVNSSFIYLLIENRNLILHINVFSTFAITSLYIFIAELVEIKHKILIRLPWRIHLSYIILTFVLIQFPGIIISDLIDLFLLLFITTVIYSYIIIFTAKPKVIWNTALRILAVGTSVYLICAFLEISIYYYQNSNNTLRSTFYLFHWGVLAFVISLIAVLTYRYIDELREKDLVQKKMLQNQQIALESVIKEKEVQKMFLRQLIITQENERQRIAGELHDSIGQDLLIAKNKLMLKMNSGEEGNVEDVSQLLSRSINDIGKLSHNLHPSELEELGLTMAVEAMLDRVSEASGINFSFEIGNIDKLIKSENRINLFRIIQEAVNNIVKHSKATEAAVRSRIIDDYLSIEICDNGIGLSTTESRTEYRVPSVEHRPHFGLAGMKDRAELIDGKLNISSEGVGTKVELTINLK